MKKKMLCFSSAIALGSACVGSAFGVTTYLAEDFQNQSGPPFGAPQVGSTIDTAGTTNLSQLSISSYPDPALPAATGGKALKVRRELSLDQTVFAMYGNAGAIVEGNTLEVSWNMYQEPHGYLGAQQVGIGYPSGGIGRLLFLGVNDISGGDVARYFYQTEDNPIYLPQKPSGELPGEMPAWDKFRAVLHLEKYAAFTEYMSGTFDLYLTRDVLNVNTPETLPVEEHVVTSQPLGVGLIPLAQDAGTPWDDLTAPLVRVSRGPEHPYNGPGTSPTYYDNFLVTGTGSVNLGADANGDGIVDTLDFNILAGNFGYAGQTFAQGDFSGDGFIDSVDFDIYLAHYGESAAPPAAALGSVVPEPASLSLIAGGLVLLRRRRIA